MEVLKAQAGIYSPYTVIDAPAEIVEWLDLLGTDHVTKTAEGYTVTSTVARSLTLYQAGAGDEYWRTLVPTPSLPAPKIVRNPNTRGGTARHDRTTGKTL